MYIFAYLTYRIIFLRTYEQKFFSNNLHQFIKTKYFCTTPKYKNKTSDCMFCFVIKNHDSFKPTYLKKLKVKEHTLRMTHSRREFLINNGMK